jgi:hypothetical protein
MQASQSIFASKEILFNQSRKFRFLNNSSNALLDLGNSKFLYYIFGSVHAEKCVVNIGD